MLTVEKTAENRIDLHLTGALTAEQMRDGLDQLAEATKDMANIRALYVIEDFQWPDASAIMVELARLPTLFSLLWKFKRVAVVAGESWIRTAAAFEGMVLPGISIKSFEPQALADAEAWLAQP